MKTKKQVIIESLQKIKGVGDFQLVAETEKVALKKSRVTKAPTPSRYEKITKVTMATVSLGNDYEKAVNKRLEDEGKATDFKAGSTYCVPLKAIDGMFKTFVDNLLKKIGLTFTDKLSKIIYRHKEKDQYYVRVYPNLAKEYKVNNVYFDADGVELSQDEFKAIEAEYLPLHGDSKQGGLENKIIVNNYKLENILYLGDKDKTPINELDEDVANLVAA